MSSSCSRLIAYDHIIESQIGIPGAAPCPAALQAPADIRVIRQGTMPAPLDDEIYRWDGATLDFTPPGVARFRCPGADLIEVAPAPHADPEEVEALLIATALPALLWLRGAFVLHAAAVVLPGSDRALAIAGPSGIGKSTLLEQLLERGARLIADDTLRVALDDRCCRISGLPGGYFGRGEGGVRQFSPVPATARLHHASLGALAFLSRDIAVAPSLDRLSGVGAVERLLANRHRPRVVDILGLQAPCLQHCARLAHRVPAYHWQRRENAPEISFAEWDALAALVSDGI